MPAASGLDLRSLFLDYNLQYFDNLLPEVPIRWNKRLRRSMGRCLFKRGRAEQHERQTAVLGIELQPGLSAAQLEKTLVHEMCHVWAFVEHNERGHGPHFWQKMSLLGFPDGHRFDSSEPDDRWIRVDRSKWNVGENVSFEHKGTLHQGSVQRVNRRTLTVICSDGRRFRCPPQLLEKNN